MRINWEGIGACPICTGKVIGQELNVPVEQPFDEITITGSLVTLSVTAICSGLLPAPLAVTVIVPVYVPGASPVGFTPTAKGVPAVPVAGTVNQLPLLFAVEAAKVRGIAPLVLFTVTFCAAGVAVASW